MAKLTSTELCKPGLSCQSPNKIQVTTVATPSCRPYCSDEASVLIENHRTRKNRDSWPELACHLKPRMKLNRVRILFSVPGRDTETKTLSKDCRCRVLASVSSPKLIFRWGKREHWRTNLDISRFFTAFSRFFHGISVTQKRQTKTKKWKQIWKKTKKSNNSLS